MRYVILLDELDKSLKKIFLKAITDFLLAFAAKHIFIMRELFKGYEKNNRRNLLLDFNKFVIQEIS